MMDRFTYNITIGEATYDSSNLLADSIDIKESLCSDELLNFNKVEKSSLTLSLINFEQDIKQTEGKTLVLTQLTGDIDVPMGKYILTKPEVKNDNLVILKGYDFLAKFDIDVSDWWNNKVIFPITHRNLLLSLCDQCGVNCNIPSIYTNCNFLINRNILVEDTLGREFLGYLQEISVCFYKMNRSGTLIPIEINGTEVKHTYDIRDNINISFADYKVDNVEKLVIRATSSDIGVIVGEGTNTYVLQANPLLYNLMDAELRVIATPIFEKIRSISYIPFYGEFKGNCSVQAGDRVVINTLKNSIDTLLLSRNLKGTNFQKDKLEAKGKARREENKNINQVIKVLGQKMSETIDTVEKFERKMTDVAAGLQTQITQQSGEINLQSEQFKYKNLLMNSDFSSFSVDDTGKYSFNGWGIDTTDSKNVYSIASDEDFPNGKALLIAKVFNDRSERIQQSIYFQKGQVKTDTLYITFDFKLLIKGVEGSPPTIYPYIEYEDGTFSNLSYPIVINDFKYHRHTIKITGNGIQKDKFIKRIAVGTYGFPTRLYTMLIGRIFVTTDTPVPLDTLWNDYAGRDVISQINLSPNEIKIQASRVDITGFVTFSSLSTSGQSIINGDNIKTGTLSAIHIRDLKSINGVSVNATGNISPMNYDGNVIRLMYSNGIVTGWNFVANSKRGLVNNSYLTIKNGEVWCQAWLDGSGGTTLESAPVAVYNGLLFADGKQ